MMGCGVGEVRWGGEHGAYGRGETFVKIILYEASRPTPLRSQLL